MNDWSYVFYISIITVAILLSLMGLWFTAVMPGIDRWYKSFFKYYFIAVIACCVLVIIDHVSFVCRFPKPAVYLVMTLECLILSLPLTMQTSYLLHSSSEDIGASRLFHTVLVLWGVYIVLLISAPFIGVFTYVTEENQYYRGPLYPLVMLPLIAILLLDLAGAIRRRTQLSRKVFIGINVALLPMIATLVANIFVNVIPFIDFCFVLSTLVMYTFVLSDQIERDLRHQREIANQRNSIMVLQMRPHFIYNTMTSIFCLIEQDPHLAQEVTQSFTTYLRSNFTAIASDAPIPFSSELEHTKAYLAVEQAQYKNSLFVDYDTPHTFFRIPPLTLQPIVENAVKHGRNPYAGPLHVSIRTQKTDSASEITVSDNGRGFDPSKTKESGIALENIRQRLEMMCGGSLTITSREGSGTVVTITIPDSSMK